MYQKMTHTLEDLKKLAAMELRDLSLIHIYGKTDGGTAEEQGAGTQQYEKVCSGCPAQSENQETGAACTG